METIATEDANYRNGKIIHRENFTIFKITCRHIVACTFVIKLKLRLKKEILRRQLDDANFWDASWEKLLSNWLKNNFLKATSNKRKVHKCARSKCVN